MATLPIPPPWIRSPQAAAAESGPSAATLPPPSARPAGTDGAPDSAVAGPGDSAPALAPHDPTKPTQDPKTGRFIKGGHGPGRPKGSRNKVTIAIENMMEGEAEVITRRCIDLAKAGDPTALRIVMDRIAPVRKGRLLQGLARRAGENSIESLLRAVLEGDLTPEEGKDVVGLIESAARVAAARALADMRRQQLEALKKIAEGGPASGGLMLVPLAGGLDEWEAIAAPMQHQLKVTVRD